MGIGESRFDTNPPTVQVPSNSKAGLTHLGSTKEPQTARSPPSCSLKTFSTKSRMSLHVDEPTTFVQASEDFEHEERFIHFKMVLHGEMAFYTFGANEGDENRRKLVHIDVHCSGTHHNAGTMNSTRFKAKIVGGCDVSRMMETFLPVIAHSFPDLLASSGYSGFSI